MRSSFGSISRSVAVYMRRHHLALVALLVALGGTSYAATKIDSSEIARNAVKSKHIAKSQVKSGDARNDSLKGADVRDASLTGADVEDDSLTGDDVLEQSLAIVPNAARAGGGPVCRTEGVLTMAEGDPDRTVCTVGVLSIVAGCRASVANTNAILTIRTSQDGAFGRTASTNYGSFDANTAQPPVIDSVSDAPMGGPEVGLPGPSSFYAGGPDGSQLAGVGGAWADADANGCRFVVSAIG